MFQNVDTEREAAEEMVILTDQIHFHYFKANALPSNVFFNLFFAKLCNGKLL